MHVVSGLINIVLMFQICDLTDLCCVAVKKAEIVTEIGGFSIPTQRLLVGSQI
jgi:hypothetical protein